MSDLTYEDPKASKLPISSLTIRVTTLVTLAVSMGLLRSVSVTYKVGLIPHPINYNDVSTYQYVFFGMVAAFGYNLLHIRFAGYFFATNERLINNNVFLLFEYYGDKLCLILLATIVGSLFGATVEKKDNVDKLYQEHKEEGYEGWYNDYHSKINEYCVMVYISSAFLLVGFLCSMVSSIMSSRALANTS